MNRNKPAAAAAVGALLAIGVGLAGALPTTASAEEDGRRLGQERRYDKAGKVLRVPERNDQPQASARAAAAEAAKYNGEPTSRSGAATRIELTRFTDEDLHEPGEEGRRRLLIVNRLAWAIVTPDVPQVVYGGMRTGPADRAKAAEIACDFVQIVDAHSGEYLEAFQAC